MSRRIKNTISNKELLQAMGGIRDCYVKEADYAACAVRKKHSHRWYVAARHGSHAGIEYFASKS